MTEQQAKRILEMRSRGMGYRSIGFMVGLSRDIVRNFCKSRGLTGYGPVLKQNVQKQVLLGKACRYCGRGMEQPATGRRRKFCSEECRRQWWKAHPEEINRGICHVPDGLPLLREGLCKLWEQGQKILQP